ncbi:MAG: LysM peptidoglycan-binding domain-containing protein [Desulfobacterales bacterium]|nr:LysM peptidoglycan-binding domain-containing protein [Desulfobacterales bacterium]
MNKEGSHDSIDMLAGLEEDFLDKGGFSSRKKNKSNNLLPKNPSKVLMGAVLIGLIVFFVAFIPGAWRGADDDMLRSMDTRLKQMEDRVLVLEGLIENRSGRDNKRKSINSHKSRTGSRYHVIRAGESLSTISNRYDMSLKELLRLNGLAPGTVIYAGDKLVIEP